MTTVGSASTAADRRTITVRAKVVPPGPPPAHLTRPGLQNRMRACLTHPLTVVSAPAGHGKSTAVADAVAAVDAAVAWVSLDPLDRSGARAWRHVHHAVCEAAGIDPLPPVDDLAPRALVEELVRVLDTTTRDLVVVIDDVDVLGRRAMGLLDRALDWLPATVRVVVIGREVPDLSLPRRRAAGRVAEVRARDLRFTASEVRAYLDDVWRLGASAAVISAVADATEGWPAVVHLWARAAALDDGAIRHPDVVACPGVVEYVVTEVLDRADPRQVRWLGALHELDVLTSPLCSPLVEDDPGEGMLDELERSGLVISQDDGTHRHHELVRAVVSRLRPAPPTPNDRPAGVVGLLDAHLLSGDVEPLEAWADRLGIARGDQGADVPHARATAHLARLRGAAQRTDQGPHVHRHALGVSLALMGWHDDARIALEDAARLAVGTGTPLWELAVVADLAWERAMAGRLQVADALVRRAVRLAGQIGLPHPPVLARLALAQIALDHGHPDLCLELVTECRADASPHRDVVAWVELGLLASRAHMARGRIAAARQALDDVHQGITRCMPGVAVLRRVARAEAALRLATGEIEAVGPVIPDLLDDTAGPRGPADLLLLARLHLKRGAPGRAASIAADVDGAGPRLTVAAHQVAAAAARARGDAAGSRSASRSAAALARANGLTPPPGTRPVHRTSRGGAIMASGRGIPTATAVGAATEDPLTARETAILTLLTEPLSNGELADRLFVSVNTVKSHLKSIYRKLDVTSRSNAVARAHDLGLL